MALKKGDIIDEYKRFPGSCGLVVKVMNGGEGFQKIVCCGHELTQEDVVPAPLRKGGRKKGEKGVAFIIDEKKSHPESCGLRLMIMDGGHGLQQCECCGHTLTLADEREILGLGIQDIRRAPSESDEQPDEQNGPAGHV
jgi:hypothetical protein